MKIANQKQMLSVMAAEAALIGTVSYKAAYAYFHHHDYRHYLHDLFVDNKKKYLRVYKALLKADLDPTKASAWHEAIITKIVGN